MTPDQLFAFGRDAIMLVVGILVFYWGRDRKQVAETIDLRFREADERMERIEQSLDSAREHSSELTGRVQVIIGRLDTMPEDLRAKFLPLDRAVDLIEESRRDRAALWVAVERGGRISDRDKLRER